MSLVTVQRSPTPSENANFDHSDADVCECGLSPRKSKSVASSECFFYVKGTAVILLNHDRTNVAHNSANGEIEEHLQAMLRMLPPEDTLTMAVRLQPNSDQDCLQDHARYLAVVASSSRQDIDDSRDARECVLLGLDCLPGDKATIGVVIPIFASTHVRLDGDGGIAVDCDSSYHLFRPVSVQAMWTMFQCLHKELREVQGAKNSPSQTARPGERLVDYYLRHISSQDAIRAEWERSSSEYGIGTSSDLGATTADAERFSIEGRGNDNSVEAQIHDRLKEVMQTVDLDDVTSKDIRMKVHIFVDFFERLEAQIHDRLKEVMQTVDLDDVTSKDIRMKVEESMGINLDDYKDFISRQMMVIMGQMDKASQIFPYLYLGTEWNACDWQWLENNGAHSKCFAIYESHLNHKDWHRILLRVEVEESMGINLDDYKDFISRQMMVIMGQMDKASQIFPYLYLGTEWNACDWQWLENNGVQYIVNVTNEVENFFPARLKYLKIRVCDEASTELLKHWNQTNQFIKEAKEKGSAVLVHCKKGISRSSSTVIAYAMKEYGWGLSQAMEHVKKKRDCITPNKGFVEQLKTFEGMLDAFKKREQFDAPPSTSTILPESPMRSERRQPRRKHLMSYHISHNIVDVASPICSCNRLSEHGSTVRSLVGSFEAKGRGDDSARLTSRTSDTHLERPPVTFRLEKLTDWKTRHSLAVSMPPSCTNTSISQIRALTISQ
uniref:protein-serine/threonine phosphatase n=1 Tax=Ascaris lumbricoides TaxID=6252 RepID=A0A0M3I2Z2_ASCLU